MGFYTVPSIIFFVLGIILIEPEITGAVVGASSSNSVFGIIFLVISGMLFFYQKQEKRKDLEKILLGDHKTVPFYESVEQGIKNMDEMSPFRAKTEEGTSYFVYVKSKKEAADLANYLVRGRRLYGIFYGKKIPRKKFRSLDVKKIEDKLRTLIQRGKIRIKRIGFARGEYETKEGRGWKREALYDKPHHPYIPLPHYDVTYGKPGKKKELHILVKKD